MSLFRCRERRFQGKLKEPSYAFDPPTWRTCVYRRHGAGGAELLGVGVLSLALERPGKVRLLHGGGAHCISVESKPARWNVVGELPVYSSGHSRDEFARGSADRVGKHARPVLLEAGEESALDPTRVQSVASDRFRNRCLRGLPAYFHLCSSRTGASCSGGGGNNAIFGEYTGHIHRDRIDGAEAVLENLDRLLSVGVSLLHGGSGDCRSGEFFEPSHRLAVVTAGASANLPDVSLLPPVHGEAGNGEEARRASLKSPPANHRSSGARHRGQRSNHRRTSSTCADLCHGVGERTQTKRR